MVYGESGWRREVLRQRRSPVRPERIAGSQAWVTWRLTDNRPEIQLAVDAPGGTNS
ncbi:hypothetical protein HLY00_4644 [Mycolicibacterium hippocampi]|uniref:Uncharacterized protein n=1 Tax=Mycolicibacterium hippocampi TaxID=659824 RepID=A0A850PDD9_9MYCO|nr:hypothetical protein [Mycolicibacterium hippocampi]